MSVRGLCLVAATLAAAAIGAVATADPPPSPAPRPPVVMIVFDEFPVDSLLGADGRIDARRFPNFARLAATSTWFPNAHAAHDSTERAVPAVLTGLKPDPDLGSTWRDYPQSVFTYLDEQGYAMHAREEVTTVCPPRLCERTRNYGRPRPNIIRGRSRRLEAAIRGLRSPAPKPTFTFQHVLLPHVPWAYLPSGRRRLGVPAGTLPEFGSPIGFDDPYLTLHNEQRYLLQLGFVDREIGKLLRRLRRQRLLDRALLIVTADHGLSFEVGADDRRSVTESNVHEVAPVPLFVKRPGQSKGAIDPAYARTTDILPTIADVLDRPLAEEVQGQSIFGASVRARSGLKIVKRDFSETIQVPDIDLRLRRGLNGFRRVDAFGTGAWRHVFEIGPNRRLLGRPTAGLDRTPSQGARAEIVAPASARYVPRSGLAPVWVTGSIEDAGGEKRDLAVAVNGRVRALASSFRLTGEEGEWFSVMVPERSLERGDNQIELFEVRGAGRELSLVRLARRR